MPGLQVESEDKPSNPSVLVWKDLIQQRVEYPPIAKMKETEQIYLIITMILN